MFNVGDIVFVSSKDIEYEEECGARYHKNFFGKVTEITNYVPEIVVEVDFGDGYVWSFNDNELSLAKELKNMTLEDFSNKYGVIVNAQFI